MTLERALRRALRRMTQRADTASIPTPVAEELLEMAGLEETETLAIEDRRSRNKARRPEPWARYGYMVFMGAMR